MTFDAETGEVWEESPPVGERVGFTDEQATELRAKLDRRRVAQREQAGRKLSYIEGWWAIREANRIFGFDGWQRETIDMRMVAEREVKIGRPPSQRDGWAVAYLCRARIRVLAGDTWLVREGTGYGSGIDQSIGQAHESAAKEAETDAMKRALMTFGNPFGLALYDKTQAEVGNPASPEKPVERPVVHGTGSGNGTTPTTVQRAHRPPQTPVEPSSADKDEARRLYAELRDAIDSLDSATDLDRVEGTDQWKEVEAAVGQAETGTIAANVMAKLRDRIADRKAMLLGGMG